MFIPLPTPSEMAGWDRESIGAGILPEILMENASRAAAMALLEARGCVDGSRVLVLAGPGNNGGDAFAIARILADHGASVRILHAKPRSAYKGSAAYNLRLAASMGLSLSLLRPSGLDREEAPDILVDGLLGTGLSGELRPEYRTWIEAINKLGERAFVLAVDIPSGLSGETGNPLPVAVRADLTVTFQAAKLGLFMPEAEPFTGELQVREIGIPRTVREANPPTHFGLGPAVAGLLPGSDPLLHKGTAGSVAVVGGSAGLTGAPLLASLGALRAGAGLVTIACPGALSTIVRTGFPEVMTLPLGAGTEWTKECVEEIAPHAGRFDAIVCGPGLGRGEGSGAFFRAFAAWSREAGLPVVFDADALYWLAAEPELRKCLTGQSVLTPHPGEMARLVGKSIDEVQADRFSLAKALASETGAVVALKGPGTVIAQPDGPSYLCPVACPNLAVGGSGDVLSGIIGSLAARGLSPLQAACLGVYWHGFSGKALERDYPQRGNLAQEIAHALPRAIKELKECLKRRT